MFLFFYSLFTQFLLQLPPLTLLQRSLLFFYASLIAVVVTVVGVCVSRPQGVTSPAGGKGGEREGRG